MENFDFSIGGRNVGRYNSWLYELKGILKNIKGPMLIATISESNSKKILNDLKDRFGIVIENAEIKEEGICIPKQTKIIFENGSSLNLPLDNINTARGLTPLFDSSGVINNPHWLFGKNTISESDFKKQMLGDFSNNF